MKFKLFDRAMDIKIIKIIIVIIVLVGCSIIIKDEIVWQFGSDDYYDDSSYSSGYSDYQDCNVAKIDIKSFIDVENYDGESVSSSEVVSAIEDANYSENIQGLILDIDSYGGLPVSAEEIADALVRADIPTVALIRGTGTSALYWASTGADVIFASALSDVGSIGVTISYLDNVAQNQMEGLHFNQLSTGQYKDMLSSDKTLTYNERLLVERDLDITLDNFIQAVADNRNLDIDKVRSLADGSSFMGQMALDNGLIDYIGSLYDVKEYLSNLIGEEVVICE